MRKIIIIALAITLLVLAAACSTAPKGGSEVNDVAVAQVSSRDDTSTSSGIGDADAIGGITGGELEDRYLYAVDGLRIMNSINTTEEWSKLIDEVIEPRIWDIGREAPLVYIAIKHFNVPEEMLREENDLWTEYNKENGLESYILTDEEISALYCGDKDEMNRRLMSPYAFYTGERVLSAFEVMMLGLDDIIKAGINLDALSEYCGRMREEIPQVSERDVEWYESKLDEM